MDGFRRASGLLSLPLTAALMLWVVTSGWSVIFSFEFFMGALVPSALLCLARYRRKRELTAGMSWAQAVSWLGFFAFGLTAVEGGGERWHSERPASHSRWTRLTGWSPDSAHTSESAARFALGVALLAWFVLFILLILDLRRHLVSGWIQQSGPFPSGPASRRRDLRTKSAANTARGSQGARGRAEKSPDREI